jgi:hypothetical protein
MDADSVLGLGIQSCPWRPGDYWGSLMVILNFSHPLTATHIAQTEVLAGQKVERVMEVGGAYFGMNRAPCS